VGGDGNGGVDAIDMFHFGGLDGLMNYAIW
jgi:hypothetical protein